ncbi:chromate efflux transporter [Rhabdaerophilum sp. SD176]|uniref:chromate efflux transporter n=1 Tax=Rhabdaerophilum sp. SD176 TaxID=2983548 RepID=UPI0024DF962D|nr:chromate efflux transporter [Rhabdaerophilum sp. SD176]
MNNPSSDPVPAGHPTFHEALAVWIRIGLLSFGGPAGQIALMHRMLVEEKRWISEARFLHALNYCMLLPGPEAQQLATYIGWLLHGVRGGIVAGTLFVLPGFCVILALSTAYALYQETAWLGALFFGLKAAVLAVVIEAVIRVGKRALKNRVMLAIAVLAFVAIFAFRLPFPVIIAAAALAGWLGARFRPDIFMAQGHGGKSDGGIVDGLAARAPATDLGLKRALTVIVLCGALWVAPVLLLGLILGWKTVFTPIATFFSTMAVVTFGGAYAVLAYVAQQAVETYQWLKPGEMLDGLALAETTPGPLILVLVYVGFLAAFRDPGTLSPLMAGVMGATLTTWVTFVPCFLWIFLGAPHIERLAGNRALSGALSAVTAAVVGVILNLAIWFGLHTLFGKVATLRAGPLDMPWPEAASLDPAAAFVSLVAMLALFRFRLGMIPTLALCGAIGLGWRALSGSVMGPI